MSKLSQRAPFNDWWYWSECLSKRFRTICDIYHENIEHTRAHDASNWSKKLKENCQPPVEAMRKGMKTDEQKAEVKRLEEEAIANAAQMFREIMVNFPFISSSMQALLAVTWQECEWEKPVPDEYDEDTGLLKPKPKKKKIDERITELFWGPKQRQDEGIRSGKVADGGLPGILYNLLAAEKTSSTRTPTDYGQALQAAAVQQQVATTKAQASAGMNFRPGGGM
ncbi:MAG: hypothetical protein WDO70_00990 [Alphaproteobacteria bacterium]